MAAPFMTELRRDVVCANCAGVLADAAQATVLGDLSFHAGCVPSCQSCGATLAADIASDWSYQVLVVSSPYGYEQVPYAYVCLGCQEQTLRDEPRAQD